jgi:predicted transcriptional regulator
VSIELPVGVEEQLRSLAATQGRDVASLVAEAIRRYLEAAAITDVDAGEVAETQAALVAELSDIPEWKARGR